MDLWRRWRGRGEDEEGEVCRGGEVVVGGGVPFSEAVCWIWGSLSTNMEPRVCLMWKLDSLNPSPLIFHNLRISHGGPHVPLIGYKLGFFLSSHSVGLNPPPSPFHLFFSTLLRYPWCFFCFFFISMFFSNSFFFPSGLLLAEWSCCFTPDVCQSVISIKLHLHCL